MGFGKLELDHAGIAELLKGADMAAAVRAAAEAVAAGIQADEPVEVHTHVTDRAKASITLVSVDALLLQARDGIMTKAASNAGLEVHSKARTL